MIYHYIIHNPHQAALLENKGGKNMSKNTEEVHSFNVKFDEKGLCFSIIEQCHQQNKFSILL